MWLASTSTSAASRSALCASLNPRCASTMARNASSGLAKFELVDSVMAKTSIQPGSSRQCGIEYRTRRMPEARRDIAVGPQQIGCTGLGIVPRTGKTGGIDKAVTAAHADHAQALRRIRGRTIAELQHPEPRSLLHEGFGQERRIARSFGDR